MLTVLTLSSISGGMARPSPAAAPAVGLHAQPAAAAAGRLVPSLLHGAAAPVAAEVVAAPPFRTLQTVARSIIRCGVC